MKYLGVDYLYNLDEKKITISQFTNREIECVLLFSQEIHSVEIAISRDVLFRELKVPFNENLFVLSFTQKTALVASRKTGKTWRVKWQDLKVTQFD